MWYASKKFNKKFREKAHPENKILKEIEFNGNRIITYHLDTLNHLGIIESKIQKLENKIDIILDIKNLKEKVKKL